MNQSPGRARPGPLVIVVVIVAAGLAGLALGSVSVPPCECPACPAVQEREVPAAPGTPIGPAAPRTGAPLPPCEPAELQRMQQRIGELRTRTAFLERLEEGYQAAKEGVPIPWTKDIPAQFREERFQAIVAEALDELQAPAELVGFDCSEPPCIAKLRVLSGSSVGFSGSKAWKKSFGRGHGGSQVSVDCGDGRAERIQLVVPLWDGKNDPATMSLEEHSEYQRKRFLKRFDGTRSEEDKNRDRRLGHRLRKLREGWTCAPVP
jgi:hypothetical protein